MGETTFVSTKNLDVCDNIIVINSVETSRDSGVLIKRTGTHKNAFFGYDEPDNGFIIGLTNYNGSSNVSNQSELNDISLSEHANLTLGGLIFKNNYGNNPDKNTINMNANNDLITTIENNKKFIIESGETGGQNEHTQLVLNNNASTHSINQSSIAFNINTYSDNSGGWALGNQGGNFRLSNTSNLDTSNVLFIENYSNGNKIGLFTITPSCALDISATSAIKIPVGNNDQRGSGEQGMIRYNTTNSQFEGYGGSAWQGLGGVIDIDQDTKILAEQNSDDDNLVFITNGGERMRIKANGDISMNHKLSIGDDLELTGTFIANSDRRIKDNLEKISESIDLIEIISGYKYTRTDLKDKTKKHIGVIAQEVEEIYPELIVENKESGIKSVNYNGLSAILIECVKSLKQENKKLKEKNENMENKLDLIMNKIDTLEKKIYC